MKLILKIIAGLVGLVVVLVAALAITVMVTLKPNIPAETYIPQPAAEQAEQHVLIFGATGKLGQEIAADLIAGGDRVTAFVRETSDRSELEPLGVSFVVGDVMDRRTVAAAFSAGEYDAVIASLAGRGSPGLDYQGNVNVFDAAADADVGRVIFISTVGAGDSHDAAPLLSRLALSEIMPDKTRAEELLRQSGMNYTILRPGGLPPGVVPTGGGILSEDRSTMGFIKRPDLARLVVGVLHDEGAINKTYAAIDPGLARPWDGADPE